MTATAKLRRIVADILRHLDHPKRICVLPLALPYFQSTQLGANDSTRAVDRLRSVLNAALDELPARQKMIITRCDFGGEMHRLVMLDLSISERQFYRDRSNALDAIAKCLATSSKTEQLEPRRAAEVALDGTTASLALSTVLFQAGRGVQAIELLQDMGTRLADPSTKSLIYSRLSEACARSSLVREAATYADIACKFATESGLTWVEAEAAVNTAYALRYSGDEERAYATTMRALPTLRGSARETRSPRVTEALGVATEIVAERALENGRPQAAIDACREMSPLLEETHSVRPSVRCGVRYWHNIATFFTPGREGAGVAGMEQLLRDALDAGFTAEAGSVCNVLAGFHRTLGYPERALQTLLAMLATIRKTCSGEALGGSLLELADAYVALSRVPESYPYIEEARGSVTSGSFIFAHSFLSESHAALVNGEPFRALSAAHRAIEQFTILGRPRLVGHALHYQALALDAVGRRDAAMQAMAQCLDRLDAYAHAAVAARAHEDAARLSGNPRRLTTARRWPKRTPATTNARLRHGK